MVDKMKTWRVLHVRHALAQEIGLVTAPTQETAIAIAIDAFDISDCKEQRELVAQPSQLPPTEPTSWCR